MPRVEKPCTLFHRCTVNGIDIVMLDVTEGSADAAGWALHSDVDVMMTFHRHPERDDSRLTYFAEEFGTESIDYDWEKLYSKLAELDPAWGKHDWCLNQTVWSGVDPELVWGFMISAAAIRR